MQDNLILKKLEVLISEGEFLIKELYEFESGYEHYNKDHYQTIARWIGSSYNLLKLRFGEQSEYTIDFVNASEQEFKSKIKYFKENIREATGVLEYVYDALKNGLTDDLFYRREILVLNDLLEQAFEFLNKEFQLAAGIYGRVVLETTIREYAAKYNIQNTQKSKFDKLIIELRLNNVITKPFENALRSNYEIGSWAAHGKAEFQNLTDSQISEYLSFIRDKVLTLE